jgi:hypothetical protein
MYFVDMFFCLFYNVRVSKPTRTRTLCREGLQNLGLCSALRAFEQGGIFIVPHLL